MGLGKKLAIGFGAAVGAPIVAAAFYAVFNHSVLQECRNEADDAGAMVVRWNLPALIGERTGKYAAVFLNRDGNVFYSVESNDRKDMEEKASAFCKTGNLPDPAP
jgi:hypothetical protein